MRISTMRKGGTIEIRKLPGIDEFLEALRERREQLSFPTGSEKVV